MFRAFDCFRKPDEHFLERYADTEFVIDRIGHQQITAVHHTWVADMDEFMHVADQHILQGYEGTMIRHLDGPYKSGRSTLKQGWLVKYKAWADAEGTVIGFEELMRNENPDLKDEFGLAKRSSHKENMVPANTLGALILETEWGTLRVGTGFDATARQIIWNRNMVKVLKDGETSFDEYEVLVRGRQPDLGRTVTFKYQPHGMQDLPRFPVFLGFREEQ
jgi:DNA ligase-1